MWSDSLLKHPSVLDVRMTDSDIYVLVTKSDTLPIIASDKRVHILNPIDLQGRQGLAFIAAKRIGDDHSGVSQQVLIEYDLQDVLVTDKQQISHQLSGTGGRSSMLKSLGGKKVGRGAVLIPSQNAGTLQSFLQEKGANVTTTVLYVEESP